MAQRRLCISGVASVHFVSTYNTSVAQPTKDYTILYCSMRKMCECSGMQNKSVIINFDDCIKKNFELQIFQR